MLIELRPWEDPSIIELGREDAHVAWGAYETGGQARACDRSASKYVLDLSGEWAFKLYDAPGDVPCDIASVRGTVPIAVPGNFELQGHSKPIYTNTLYPWAYEGRQAIYPNEDGCPLPHPPFIPADNPTGIYLKTIDISEELLSREAFIEFDGVEAAFCLWVNGAFAGFSQDSKLPAAFNITRLLQQGANHIALMVTRWSYSTYLEDQDY